MRGAQKKKKNQHRSVFSLVGLYSCHSLCIPPLSLNQCSRTLHPWSACRKLAAQNPQGGVHLDHAFGREFPDLAATSADGLGQYALAIHCGGCMVDRQKILARIQDLKDEGVPVTNFGLLLCVNTPEALWRVVAPYGLFKEQF